MALRLRRDVQKAAYYVWFLGAEEAKGLRGPRVINSVLPYLIERSRSQDVLKVTLQVSYKGIKIIQGSSKHFIPHSAITSSTQTNDIVACVLLLYNPITKCPLHVHAYRCDSETTAQALHQQLQILINRPENQKRFQELETRLGISLPIPSKSPLPNAVSKLPAYHTKSNDESLHHRERDETSPKRFSSSLGSDTGNSTRESDCSSDQLQGSPISHSPTVAKVHAAGPIAQNSELFDSLAAELRAKLNGNGPPLLLPPRDYDTVHRSKGNLAAIELRRCRNKLIVGSTRPTTTDATPPPTTSPEKQVFSLASSSGIGSDLAPSPERQDLNSSSDEEQWTNEMDNPVIALKSQIAMAPIMPAHPQLNRKSAIPPPQDSYLRDLPSKPYVSRQKGKPEQSFKPPPSSPSKYNNWSREDEIKPIIMRPADYDAKFNRVLQAEQRHEYARPRLGEAKESSSKLKDVDKYNEVNRSVMEKLSLHNDSPEHGQEDLIDSGQLCDHIPLGKHRDILGFSKENLTDKQKVLEYAKKFPASYVTEDSYSGSIHYPDADHHLEQFPAKASKYHARHEEGPHHSMKQYDVEKHVIERERERERERDRQRERCKDIDGNDRDLDSLGKARHPGNYPLSGERNPYREPDSLPYIKSMEKMMKSSALRYKSGQTEAPPEPAQMGENFHSRVSQRSKSYPKNIDNGEREYLRNTADGHPKEREYLRNNADGHPKEREYLRNNADGHPKDREYLRNNADGHPKEREYLRNTADVHPKEREYLRNTADVHPKEREYLRNTADVHPKEREYLRNNADKEREYLRNTADVHPKDRYKPAKKIIHGSERSEDHRFESQPVREMEKPGPGYKMWSDEDESAGIPMGQQQFSHKMRSRSREKLWKSEGPSKERDYGYDMKERDLPGKRMYLRNESRYEEQSAPMLSDYGPPEMYPSRQMERHEFSPDRISHFTNRSNEKRKGTRSSSSSKCDMPIPANMENSGYRNSYAEPVFVRTGGRVGLAAVDPY